MPQTFSEIEQKLIGIAGTASLEEFVADTARDDRIDDAARLSLIRLSMAGDRPRMAATALAAAVRSATVAGIAAASAAAHELPGATAADLTGPLNPGAPPMLVYRDDLAADDERLDQALLESASALAASAGPGVVAPVASISCMVWCALCAAAIADGVPFDEIFACLVCLTCATDA